MLWIQSVRLEKSGRMKGSWHVKRYLWQVFSSVSQRRERASVIFHDDNAKAHRTWMRNEFFLENHLAQYENAADSPDWSPCDFFLFAKVKKHLRGIRFNDDNEIWTAFKQAFDTLAKEDFPWLVYSNALMLKEKTSTKWNPLNTSRTGLWRNFCSAARHFEKLLLKIKWRNL